MTSIYASGGFIGSEWFFRSDLLIEIENSADGYIVKEIKEDCNPSDADIQLKNKIVFPCFVNSHTHIADTIGKDICLNFSLVDAVGRNGLKFDLLRNNSVDVIKSGILSSLQEMKEAGVASFVDFREGGLKGLQIFQEAISEYGKDKIWPIIYGRPSKFGSDYKNDDQFHHEIFNLLVKVDGLGLSSIADFTNEQLEIMCRLTSNLKKKIAIHALESSVNSYMSSQLQNKKELDRILDVLKAQILIHLTQATIEDFYMLNDVEAIVFCPRSNVYFGLGFPPISTFFKADIRPSPVLGTDNAMSTPPSILDDARYAALSLRSEMKIDPTVFLKMISSNPAEIFGLKVGKLEPGTTNFLALNLDSPRIRFSKNLKASLLLRANPTDYFSPLESI